MLLSNFSRFHLYLLLTLPSLLHAQSKISLLTDTNIYFWANEHALLQISSEKNRYQFCGHSQQILEFEYSVLPELSICNLQVLVFSLHLSIYFYTSKQFH